MQVSVEQPHGHKSHLQHQGSLGSAVLALQLAWNKETHVFSKKVHYQTIQAFANLLLKTGCKMSNK